MSVIKSAFISLLIIASSSVFASNNYKDAAEGTVDKHGSEISEITYSSVDDIFRSISNRMVLALFGKSALSSFLGNSIDDSVRGEIGGMDLAEVSEYSSPFPATASSVFGAGFIVLYIMTFTYWVYFMSIFVYERFYHAQSDGVIEKTMSGGVLGLARSFIIMVLTVPIFGTIIAYTKSTEDGEKVYSVIHHMLFSLLGKSIRVADEISYKVEGFAPEYFPVYRVPAADALAESMDSIIDFGICVAGTAKGGDTINVSPVVNDEKYSLNVNFNSCSAIIDVSADVATGEIIDGNPKIKEIIGFNGESFNTLQMDTINNIAKDIITQSIGYGAAYINNYNMNEHQFVIDMGGWYEKCTGDISDLPNTVSGGRVMGTKKIASRCLSKMVVERLSYPAEVEDLDSKFFDNKLNLPFRQHELCSAGGGSEIINIDDSNIEGCLKKSCSSLSSTSVRSGLFECGVAVAKYDNFLRNKKFSHRGFMNIPSRYLTLIGSNTVPEQPKVPLTSFNALGWSEESNTDLTGSSSSTMNQQRPESKYSLNITPTTPSSSEKFDTYSKFEYSIKMDVVNMPNFVSGEDDGKTLGVLNEYQYGVLGVKKFLKCLETPMSAREDVGYCHSPIMEIHLLGKNMLSSYVALKAGSLAGRIVKSSVRLSGASKEDESGRYEQKLGKGKFELKRAISTTKQTIVESPIIASVFASIGGGAAISKLIDVISPSNTVNGDLYGFQINDSIFIENTIAFTLGFVVAGQDPEKAGGNKSPVESAKGWILVVFGLMGFMFAYVIPFAPLIIFMSGVVAIWASFIAILISSSFQIVYVFAAMHSDTESKIKKVIATWISVTFRAPLLIMGYFFAMSLIATLYPYIVGDQFISNALMLSSFSDSIGLINFFVKLIVFIVMSWVIISAINDTINGFYNLAKSIIFGEDVNVMGDTNTNQAVTENKRLVQNLIVRS